MRSLNNIFQTPSLPGDDEFSELLAKGDVKIERIISTGQITPFDSWYDQEQDEWVILLEGEARLQFSGEDEILLKKGDYLFIKAHEKHRVTYTSVQPACIWLAIHGKLIPDYRQ